MLVALICINGRGCDEAFNTYTYRNPSVVEMANTVELNVRKLAPSYIFEYALPLAASTTGVDISVKINRNLSIKNNRNITQLTFKKEF